MEEARHPSAVEDCFKEFEQALRNLEEYVKKRSEEQAAKASRIKIPMYVSFFFSLNV